LKLCTRDHTRAVTLHANFGFNRYSGAFPQIGKTLPLCGFRLSCHIFIFFSILPLGRTAGPIFTL